jgi:GNAT superfamily N-acetyltransferase
MFYRVRSRDFERLWGEGARAALREVVADGPPPGLLAYRDGTPVGWCAVAPRDAYSRVLNSRVLRPVDDAPDCWAVVCFYVVRGERHGGVAAALLEAAVDFAGAKKHANEMFVGSMSMFQEAGFEEVARRSAQRPIMRRQLSRHAGRGGRGGSR